MPPNFMRPREGFRYRFSGIKLNAAPDSCPPDKYPMAVNVRAVSDSTVQTRPGQVSKFTAGNFPVTDMRAYTQLSTDNQPRILARDSANGIWLDNGVKVATLAGGSTNPGVAMIPFRPGASATPYMYIANGSDYQKLSAPVANAVTAQKVGIAEPQTNPDAGILNPQQSFIGPPTGGTTTYVNAGTAGAINTAGTRVNDTIQKLLADPVTGTYSVQVTTAAAYQRFMVLLINGGLFQVTDVFPALPAITIASIFYFSGTTGRCIVSPVSLAAGGVGSEEASIYAASLLVNLRRGAMVKIGTEVSFVLSSSLGPDGTISFETSTISPHTSADVLASVPTIHTTATGTSVHVGDAITSPELSFQVTTGVGTITAPTTMSVPSGNPFIGQFSSFHPQDYIHFSVNLDVLANLTEMKILFDVGDGSFTQNYYYYTVRPADIAAAVANTLTQLGAAQLVIQRAAIDAEDANAANNQGQTASSAQTSPGSSQWSEIVFPISALTRVGNDETKTLHDVTKIQFLFNASNTVNVLLNSVDVTGGSQPDVGDVGAPYLYRVRPRSMATGVVGNPSPATRYGVNPRRQSVKLTLPSAAYDAQIDTWDVFRYGGSVTSWRYVGSTPSANSTFTDNFSDAALGEGDLLEFDNFEPWPTVDVPNNGTATSVVGTVAVVTSTNANILSYLPGTLVQLGGINVYTLWVRPTLISGNSYLLQFEENAGSQANVAYAIQEPALANQKLPYMWGPDAAGTVFAVGDALRPGSVNFAKNYAPDSVPDTYNLEITPPSEPLLGGEVLDGLSFVASPERWWALYPNPDNPAQRYSIVQMPFARGLAAPWGHSTDGQTIYWWAKDGIQSSTKGSLTDADLYNLFPHEGVLGVAVTYGGVTVQPPDYSRAAAFRLTYANYYLYAVYQDATGTYRCLTLDVRRGAWCVDAPVVPVSAFYHPEQPAGTLQTVGGSRYDELLMANVNVASPSTPATVCTETFAANDVGAGATAPIACTLATFEFDGGDVRAPKQWGDVFVDSTPAAVAGVIVTPMSLGVQAVPPVTLASSAVRVRQPVSVGGTVVSEFMGLRATWTDDFTQQSAPTQLHVWQPSFAVQPAYTIAWSTFGSAFGLNGYMHIRQIELAWVSTQPITLTVTSYDGQSPAAITIPSSSGAYQKAFFPLTANKGHLFKFQASSAAKFQIFLEDSEIHVGAWSREGPYLIRRDFGTRTPESAQV